MAKRFTATEIWEEDWFLDMPIEYKLFWYYMLSSCDHAGLFKVNIKSYCLLNEVNLTPKKALDFFNKEKERIRVLSSSIWLVEDFFVYQYGHILNFNNRVHNSIADLYKKHGILLTSIRGLKEVIDRVKDKDKDKGHKKEGKGVGKGDWNIMPKLDDVNDLPAHHINSIIELMKITRQTDVTKDDVVGMWKVFKTQNLTGKKYYGQVDDVYSHYTNWIKDKKFERRKDDGNGQQGRTYKPD